MRQHLKTISIIAALAVAALAHSAAHAQTTCTTTSATPCIGATKTTGESPLSTQLIWSYPGAASCTASGASTGWSGPVATSGTKSLSGITIPMNLKLDCLAASVTSKFRLRWIRPTQNTDGSALANLGGYVIEYGTSSGSLTQTITLPLSSVESLTPTTGSPFDSGYTIDGLAAGTWFAALKTRTSTCFPTVTVTCRESVQSSVASGPVTTSPGGALPQLSVQIEPYQVPKAPTNVVATEVIAYQIDATESAGLVAKRVELEPISTNCDDTSCTVLTRRTGAVQQ